MKKFFALMLTVAMLLTAVAAFAENGNGSVGGQPPMMEQGGPQGQAPSGGKPQGAPQGQAPSGEKPSDAPEKPTGEKPADAPEEPEDLTGEKPADAPEKPTDGQAHADGQTPPEKPEGTDGQTPPEKPEGVDGQQDPKMIDFDAMVTKGIISQETREKIQAYMEEHKPEGEAPQAPVDGQAPSDGQTPPEKPADSQTPADGQQVPENDLLTELLNAGVITQTEYDAMIAA